jgi:glutamate synthase (NADPH/NADH) small chain
MGHRVVVYERDEGPGGLIRLGVPDFKLEKWIIDRRVALLEQAGISFEYGVDVGTDLTIDELNARHDAVVLALGSRVERGIDLPGSDLGGIHSAMEYLLQRNRAVAGQPPPSHVISAAGKHVVVIGGGDTAADCVASAHREHATSVTQLDIYPPPAGKKYRELTTWPDFPKRLWSTYALDEGGQRHSAFNATGFIGDGHVRALRGDKVGDPPEFAPTGESHELPADLVLIAIGFTGVERGLVDQLGVALGDRGAIDATDYATSTDGVFAAGDARRGQSLIVWAIAEGRECARAVERYLTRSS